LGAYSGDTAKANTILGLYSYQLKNWLQFWNPNGNVGIGTGVPGAKLTIAGPEATVNVETAEVLRIMRPGVLDIKNNNSAGFFVGAFQPGINGASRLDINVAGMPSTSNAAGSIPDNTVMTLQGDGKIGIGTTIPGTGTTGQGGTNFGTTVLDLVSTGRPVLGIKSDSASGNLATLMMSASNNSSKDIHWNLDSSGSLTLYQYSAQAYTIAFYNNGNVGIRTLQPDAPLTVAGLIHNTAGGIKFPDGSIQTTATLRGPQGPRGSQGPQGSPGPVVHTSAVCGPLGCLQACSNSVIAQQSGPCAITSDTGNCNAPDMDWCCVCAP